MTDTFHRDHEPARGTVQDAPPTTQAVPRTCPEGPWLLELGSPERQRTIILRLGERLTVGSGALAAVRVEDRTVSSMHCELAGTESGVGLEDLHSRNGVYVGSARVRSALLASDGSSFVMGNTTVVVHPCPDSAIAETATRTEDAVAGLIGGSVCMRRLSREIHRVGRLCAPVLLAGESGTGKDVVARALHDLSGRAGPYVPLNASALNDNLADTELFGHQRGAFTGALANRTGSFEQAHRGTLFLDEVADLSLSVQVKLLRVVEDGLVRRVGSAATQRVDVRLISASWVDLPGRVEEGTFRPDLYHRIATFVLKLPPLRERLSDIPALATHLLRGLREELGPKRLSSAAVAGLTSRAWPGNVRELRAALYRAAAAAPEEVIGVDHFEAERARPSAPKVREVVDVVELMKEHGGNIAAASRSARMPRTTFRNWLERARRANAL